MIIDLHTHLTLKKHFIGDSFLTEMERGGGDKNNIVTSYQRHENEVLSKVDKAVVFGIKAEASGWVVPNEFIADYVKLHQNKVIGFASVDPNQPDADIELEYCIKKLNLKGLKLGPIYQHFNPQNEKKAYPIYEIAQEYKIPIMWHMGTSFVQKGLLEFTKPLLLERIALDFPELKMIIAHMGHPWENDTIVLIRKQPNVFADISALYYRPWQFYNTMVLAQEYKVIDKIFFGTDFPFTTLKESINGIKAIKKFWQNTNLPQIPDSVFEDIINRDSLKILGIE